jgi:hypothetical protein
VNAHLDLVRELKSLRKGRGVYAGRIEQRIGPTLRSTFGIAAGDGPVATRQKVLTRLTALADRLPEDLRLVTLAAFAINSETRLPLYQDRVHWAAIRIDRDARTVRRRVDEAINQLAELAASEPAPRARGWHTAELHVAVALDRHQPEVLEQHRIIAHEDGLREVDLPASLSATPTDLDVYYGGTLITRRTHYALALPTPLPKGESHDFAVGFRLPNPSAMPPHLLCIPPHPYDLFDLRIRFGPTPSRVWTVHGTHPPDPTTPPRNRRHHPVDQAGEIHLRFHHLTPGLAYGAEWE